MIRTLRTVYRIWIPKGQRVKWVALAGLALSIAAAETVTALLIFRVLNFATESDRGSDTVELVLGFETSVTLLLVLAGTAFVARGLLSVLFAYAQARVIQNASVAVAARIHRRYLKAPYRFHLTRSSSKSLRTVLFSVDLAAVNALTPLVTMTSNGLVAVTLLVLLIGIAPTLTFAAIAVLGIGLGLVLVVVQPRLVRRGKQNEVTTEVLLQSVRDAFDNVRDIKVYRVEDYFDRRFRHHRSVLAKLRITKALLEKIPMTALEYMVVLGLLLVIGLAYSNDSFNDAVPVLGAFGYATLRIVPSINKVVNATNRLKFGQQAVENVANDLASTVPEPMPQEPLGREPDTAFEDSIELEDATFRYPQGERDALAGINLRIGRGELVAVAGGSGSGKSTLVDVLLGLLEIDSGKLFVDGTQGLPLRWYRHVGLVSQTVVLLDASIRENVAFGEQADDARVVRAMERAQLGDFIARLPHGLDTTVGEAGKLVSGGERQRIAIARSLYREPDLLILDEATSALDGATEAALMKSLREMSGEMTTIVVSHRLAPIQTADRVVMMDEGRISASGTYEELVARAADFRDLVGL